MLSHKLISGVRHSRLVALGHPVLRDISASLHTKPLPHYYVEVWERLQPRMDV